MYNLSSFLPISNQFCVIAGNSGAGKSSFCKNLCEYIVSTKHIYYFNPNHVEFTLSSKPVHILKELKFCRCGPPKQDSCENYDFLSGATTSCKF